MKAGLKAANAHYLQPALVLLIRQRLRVQRCGFPRWRRRAFRQVTPAICRFENYSHLSRDFTTFAGDQRWPGFHDEARMAIPG